MQTVYYAPLARLVFELTSKLTGFNIEDRNQLSLSFQK